MCGVSVVSHQCASEPRDCTGLASLFIPSRLVKKPGTRIYRGNIEMRNTGRSPAGERKRDTVWPPFPFTNPASNVHTSHSPPPGFYSHPACTLTLGVFSKKLTTAVALRAGIFHSRTYMRNVPILTPLFSRESVEILRVCNQTRISVYISLVVCLAPAFITDIARN